MDSAQKAWPSVLIVWGNPLNTRFNNGLTMTNLFRGWQRERLAQIFMPSLHFIPPGDEVCDHFWPWSPLGAVKALWSRQSQEYVFPRGQAPECAQVRQSTFREQLRRVVKNPRVMKLAYPARELLFMLDVMVPEIMWDWIESRRPEVIFSSPNTVFLLRLVTKISERYDLPIVPHFTDDWFTTQYLDCYGSSYLRKRMDYWLAEMLKRAPNRMVISDMMGEEFRRRYGGEYETFNNCLDKSKFDLSKPPREPDARLRLLYVGGLHSERWRSLQEIGRALAELDADEGLRGELVIHTFGLDLDSYGKQLSAPPHVQIKGPIPNDEIPQALQRSDILVHVESFISEAMRYVRYSLSTKIPEYMMAGRCLLAYGPEELASIRYVRDSGAGLSITEGGVQEVKRKLRELLADESRRERYAERAREVAVERHDGPAVRERFRQTLCNAAAAGMGGAR